MSKDYQRIIKISHNYDKRNQWKCHSQLVETEPLWVKTSGGAKIPGHLHGGYLGIKVYCWYLYRCRFPLRFYLRVGSLRYLAPPMLHQRWQDCCPGVAGTPGGSPGCRADWQHMSLGRSPGNNRRRWMTKHVGRHLYPNTLPLSSLGTSQFRGTPQVKGFRTRLEIVYTAQVDYL